MNKMRCYLYNKIDAIKSQLLKQLELQEKFQKKILKDNDEIINKKSSEIEVIKKENIKLLKYQQELKQEIEDQKSELDSYNKKINLIEKQYRDCVDFGPEIPEAYGMYDRVLQLENSNIYKHKIDDIRKREKDLHHLKEAIISDTKWEVNHSRRDGNKLVNRMSKLAMRAFNGECDAIIESVKYYSKIDAKHNKLNIIFKTMNDFIEILNLRISQKFLNLKFEELNTAFEYENALAKEREELKKQRELERDEEIAKREFQQEIKRIDKEKNHFSNELEKMVADMKEAQDIEKNNYLEKISLLEQKIAELIQKREDFQNRFANKAGYVYIISNIGSFGEGIYKIGTTRRIDPFERINELSNASVPFKFDHFAIIFSENCYELEHSLHQKFENNRVNKFNLWKEYFKIDKDDLINEIKLIDPTVKINDINIQIFQNSNDSNIRYSDA